MFFFFQYKSYYLTHGWWIIDGSIYFPSLFCVNKCNEREWNLNSALRFLFPSFIDFTNRTSWALTKKPFLYNRYYYLLPRDFLFQPVILHDGCSSSSDTTSDWEHLQPKIFCGNHATVYFMNLILWTPVIATSMQKLFSCFVIVDNDT